MSRDYVVLLHGLGRTKRSMRKMANFFTHQGYEPINEGYPSTRYCIRELCSTHLQSMLARRCSNPSRTLHFVTHSLGGILVRCYLQENHMPNLGRVVMLAPPNQGSEVVDWLRDNRLYKRLLGPAGQELGTGSDALPARLGPVDFELGVIAGSRSVNPINSQVIEGPNDGKVSLERAKVPGMQDFLVVHIPHPFIMRAEEVLCQANFFLKEGRFQQ